MSDFYQPELVKIVVFTPVSHSDQIREALANSNCGHIGNYDHCTFSTRGVGRFRPLAGTDPFIGETGKIEKVDEERIETICEKQQLSDVLKAIKAAHPYEEPAIDVYPLLNSQNF